MDQLILLLNAPLTIALMVIEIIYSTRYDKQYYTVKDTKANLILGGGYILIDALTKGAGILMLAFFYTYGFHLAPSPNQVFLYWFSLLILEDFVYWFMHLMDHRVRFLWAGHIHHHSSKEFNFSVGLRSAVFEPIEKFFFFIPLAVIGYQPIDIVFIYLLSQGWGTFVHTRTIKKLGVLEYIFTTPSHHRVHHARNVKYLDKNYGMFLIIWDKIFGTFEPEDPNEPVDYGTLGNIDYKNYMDIIFYEYQQIVKDLKLRIPFQQKIRYIFGPPGYSHDGSRKTTRQLQNEE
jgi:sterol desaturase/sphingolipid hydroxylase (fatty acid hydroxylase superfamily)